jgi:hypothetical protein
MKKEKQYLRFCGIDVAKNKHDAVHIANLLRTGQHKAAVVPGELAMTCRQLTRLRYRMIRQMVMTK